MKPRMCDFCESTSVRWRYPAKSFSIGVWLSQVQDLPEALRIHLSHVYREASRGGWLACDGCHEAIERGDWARLADRTLGSGGLDPSVREPVLLYHQQFRKHRRGPAIVIPMTPQPALAPQYIEAIETRLAWWRWALQKGEAAWDRLGFREAMPAYRDILAHADTYCMSPQFAALVDQARRDVPDDLTFEAKWLQSKCGFIWLDQPFDVPLIKDAGHTAPGGQNPIMVRAVGWREIPEGAEVIRWEVGDNVDKPRARTERAGRGTTQVCCFQDFRDYRGTMVDADGNRPTRFEGGPADVVGFGAWSYFILRDGDRLGDRTADFETRQAVGQYVGAQEEPDRREHPLHEIRWVYTALHLMAQKLAITVRRDTDRATRRRAERNRQTAPSFIEVVTLRRLEADRQRDPKGIEVDWQWQWIVEPHWRNQWYPSEGVHKTILIESYVKGPPDRPLKPSGIKLFVARR